MVRGGKTSHKTNADKTVRSKDKYSDDSDEDYVISDEENEGSGEDYCSSLEAEASDEEFDRFKDDRLKDDEEEVELANGRRVIKSEAKKDTSGQRTEGMKSKTRRVSSDDDYKQNEDSDEEDDYEEEKEENDDDNDDDEEFTLDEEDSFDEVKESTVVRDKKMGNPGLRKKGTNGGCKRRRKSTAANTRSRKRTKKNSRSGKKIKEQTNDDLVDKSRILSVKSKKVSGQRKRRSIVNSDSDFEPSGSSDYEYTISEEEREQIREAEELCGNLVSSLRSSSLPKEILEEKSIRKQRKPLGRKGKEKVEEVKVEVVKQLCGICLSEEDKRRVRGTLECCTHYFCFTCIMEWAKVESRCPLCKQRFKTISKPARSAAGVDLREVVVQVPERDQVYQPSEEELMSYLDPYEHVLCTECHEGGDDGLMLLCDLCDSPAHTYCVGLGGVVPEGNWYCDGCKPVAMGSGSQGQGRFSNRRTTANNLNNRPSPAVNIYDGLDLNSIASPRMSFGQGFGNLSSPRFPHGNVPLNSPVPGAGAPTLSGRRWIHRHIQQLLSSSRTGPLNSRPDVITTNLSGGLSNSLTNQGRETTLQESRPQVMATSYNVFFEERLNLNPPPSVQRGDFFSSGSSHLRRQAFQNLPTSASANSSVNAPITSPVLRHGAQHLTTLPADRPINDMIWSELMQINSVSGFNELQPCNNRLNVGGPEGRSNPHMMKDETDFHMVTDQLQSMIQIHLKDLSRNIDSGHISFKAVEQSAINTILAACGIENRGSDVYQVAPPSICSHIELTAGGQTTSLVKGCCSACFNSFVGDVVKKILNTSLSQWLSLGL